MPYIYIMYVLGLVAVKLEGQYIEINYHNKRLLIINYFETVCQLMRLHVLALYGVE